MAKYLVTNIPSSVARGVKHLKSVIEERYRLIEEHGSNWEGKPNDMLMWLMEEATGKEKNVEALVIRILAVNFAAIHTSSMSFGDALFRLASHPEYIAPMRAEVEAVIASDGWTKLALQKMRKVDSFLRECQRVHGIASIAMSRRAMKDFQFSDGTFIPKGTYLSLPVLSTHTDSEYYEEPNVFNPWRFSDIREEEGERLKHQMVSTSSQYIAFGHGKHACPGRFFAANELKCMMAHLVLNYDVRMEQEGVMPVSDALMFGISPNPKAEVLFRKRQGS
ncbi:hypothetical protein NLI96_g8125 [Meripilus lineatus]|uniref:Cytochrome P450 n=1 Tax=Meripilus lineatus TaxID=2056292 RepID=A0AAD5UY28_9APHY|nr:hypothetical protein NLI96_g8125 [Physisporinus lineatus]